MNAKSKDLEQKNQPYADALNQLLCDMGAEAIPSDRLGAYRIDTKAGPLRIQARPNSAYGGASVYARFDDVEQAVALLGSTDCQRLNPYSGKWNHHYFDVPLEDAIVTLRRALLDIIDEPGWPGGINPFI